MRVRIRISIRGIAPSPVAAYKSGMDIRAKSMLDMKWPEIESEAEAGALVLLPLGVIEEHGPHLCLGTDIYTAQIICGRVQELLRSMGKRSVIGPPFFWGICQATRDFIGSFGIRMDTARNLVLDILDSLRRFGFRDIFGINGHGDIEQNILFMNSFKEAREKGGIGPRYCFREDVMHYYGLGGDEDFICPIPPQTTSFSSSAVPDIHAGDIETAIMSLLGMEYVDTDLARTLPPIGIEKDREMEWILGGKTKEISAQGYLGNPAVFEEARVEEHLADLAERYARAILGKVQG